MITKCIRCECMLTMDFTPLDKAGAYSLCETCFMAYVDERGVPGIEVVLDGVHSQPIPTNP